MLRSFRAQWKDGWFSASLYYCDALIVRRTRHATDAVYGGSSQPGSALLGLFLGSLGFGVISDHIGRQI